MKTNFWNFTWIADFFHWIGNFFSEIKPQSILRLESFIIVCTGCGILIGQFIKGIAVEWVLGGAFVMAGLISKVAQKQIEVKGQQTMQQLQNAQPKNITEVKDALKTT